MLVDLLFSPLEIARCQEIDTKVVVVIDVLRASSVINYAFMGFGNHDLSVLNGAKEIIPAMNVEEAFSIYNSCQNKDILLAGEVNGLPPEGFHLGNSPLEFKVEAIKDRSLIMATTNGTRTINMLKGAKNIVIGSFLNAFAIARYCISKKNDVIIACAGTKDRSGLEDITCGGLIASYIKDLSQELSIKTEFSDSAIIASRTYYSFNNPEDILRTSKHGQYLINKGLGKDIEYCALKNRFNLVPLFSDNKLIPKLLTPVTFTCLYN